MRTIVCAAALILARNLLAQDNSPTNELYELKGDVLGMSLEELTARHGECMELLFLTVAFRKKGFYPFYS